MPPRSPTRSRVGLSSGGRSPTQVAGRGADQQRALPDPERRGDAEADQVGFLLAHLVGVVLSELGYGGPLFAVPADVLPLVGADRAAWGGCSVSGYCTPQVAEIQAVIDRSGPAQCECRRTRPHDRSNAGPGLPFASSSSPRLLSAARSRAGAGSPSGTSLASN